MYIRVDDDNGYVKVGDDYLPGILQSISIGGNIIYEKSSDKESKNKVVSGYEDKSISISITIVDDDRTDETRYDVLARVEKMFMKTKDSLPKTYTIVNSHVQARNIDKVLMKSLSSSEDNGSEKISISLEFVEFEPAKYQLETKEDKEKLDEATAEKEKKEKENAFNNGITKGYNDTVVRR